MITDRRRLLRALAAAPALAAMPGLALARTRSAEADAVLDQVFAAQAPPALAAGVVGKDGVIWSGVRGMRQAGGTDPATLQDRWHLGSNTKAMTAALFARLVEQGRASWDMTVAQAFPDLTLDPAWRDVKLTRLMHHRAGLADASVIGREWLMTARGDPASLPEQRKAIAAAAFAVPPAGAPGAFAYGNANYIVLGAAIEAITGQSWENAMRAQVFQPLGLASAGFGPPPSPNAWGHRPGPTPIDPTNPGADNPLALGPAGTVHMTLDDYARFVRVFLKDGDGWLSPASITTLTTPGEGEGPTYACGWIVREQPWGGVGGPGVVLGHEGSNTMWHAMVLLAPARGTAVIALSNDGQAGRAAVQALGPALVPVAFP